MSAAPSQTDLIQAKESGSVHQARYGGHEQLNKVDVESRMQI